MLLCSKDKLSLPLLIFIFLVAPIDFASAFGWPPALLSLLHLTPQTSDCARGICTGLGAALSVIALFLLARLLARRFLLNSHEAR